MEIPERLFSRLQRANFNFDCLLADRVRSSSSLSAPVCASLRESNGNGGTAGVNCGNLLMMCMKRRDELKQKKRRQKSSIFAPVSNEARRQEYHPVRGFRASVIACAN
eukprot:CAMPEP_0117446282 /NCGR_PEP_ID=MMETSP0759-20121206/6253_1 /TAXON_ID=63605 /ORGANISM="Percolomonas cosmopolitus, Strain WS" /LENGTH=107 /DNA_ID=CAMNT_0005238529 /DNA_START=208 /DNA_END=531 /DNA_ORIENTATION=-